MCWWRVSAIPIIMLKVWGLRHDFKSAICVDLLPSVDIGAPWCVHLVVEGVAYETFIANLL